MPPVAAAAVVLAAALDGLAAEFPERVHPVALFGRVLGLVDRPWSRPGLVGVGVAAVLPLVAGLAAAGTVALAAGVHPAVAAGASGVVLFSTTSRRMLLEVAQEVVATSEGDLAAARAHLPALVGRDVAALSPGEVRSAAVESAAENLADGLVAPLLAFALLAPWSLTAATGAAAWVKAVNTADSMLGYRSKPVGRASARLDDAVMWLPARLSALLIVVAARNVGALVRARRWARRPPSPNSGWPMAALAAVLDVRLSKPGSYTLDPGGQLPGGELARRGVRVVGHAGGLAFVGAGVVAWF